jgi:hypothetical protein
MQLVNLSMGEKPAIIREEMANAPYGAAGVVTDGVLTKGIRVNVGDLKFQGW